MATAPKTKSSTKAKPAAASAKKAPVAAEESPAKVAVKLGAKSAAPKKTQTTPVAKPTQAPALKATVAGKPSKAQPKKSTPAAVTPPVKEKVKKAKLVRDSFTMPEAEYAVLGEVKKTCLAGGIEVKKSQLLRIGLALLSKTELPDLKRLIEALPPLKAGRPKVG
ncbi:MAG: hypothetical protein Q8Q55_01765 [Undibacterium sp.]|nr:hypothetical protein [Undibacterium sp.]